MEEAYPADLACLKQNYGLTYDGGLLFVDYRTVGSAVDGRMVPATEIMTATPAHSPVVPI